MSSANPSSHPEQSWGKSPAQSSSERHGLALNSDAATRNVGPAGQTDRRYFGFKFTPILESEIGLFRQAEESSVESGTPCSCWRDG